MNKVNTWKRRNVDFGGSFRLSSLWLAHYCDCGMGACHSDLSGEHSSFPQGGGKQEQEGSGVTGKDTVSRRRGQRDSLLVPT